MNRKRPNPYLLANLLGAVFNGEGEGGGGEGEGGKPQEKAAGASTSSGQDKGFPANTPLEEMTSEQREAYWKDKARKHEDRAKAFGNLTADELAELRERAAKQAELERELMSDKDRAVAEAKDAAAAEARAQFAPRLVAAEFKAASAGRIEADRLAAILEPLDLTKFLDGDQVDADKVAAYVNGIAPAPEEKEQRRGPSPAGAGRRGSSTGPSLQSGADLYRERKSGRRG